ncbi:MAG: PAS domain S-box protein [Haloarculaceae archaeon]
MDVSGAPIRVLYAHADRDVGGRTAEILERTDDCLRVESVASGRVVLDRLAEGDVDCVVAADALADVDAFELFADVRAARDVPFVLYPDEGSTDLASEAMDRGVTDYFPRSADADDHAVLATRIRSAVERRRAERETADVAGPDADWSDADRSETDRADADRPDADRPDDDRLQAFFDHSPDACVVHDAEGDVVDVNRQAVENLGYPREELRSMNVADFEVGVSRDALREAWTDMAVGQRVKLEGTHRRRDGTTYPVDVWLTKAEVGNEERFVALGRDVTERKERERRLRLFRQAVEAAGHAIYFADRDGTIEYVNPAFEEITGYTAAEAVGSNPRILKSGEHDEEYYEQLWETILDGETWRDEVVDRTKDGERYVVDQTIAPVENAAGDVEYFVAVNADISERKERESRLRRFRSAVEHAGHGVIITDVDGTIEYVNPAFEETTGYTAAEAIDRTPAMLKSGEHDHEFYRDLWETILGGDVWQGEVTNERKDGTRYVVDQTIAPIFDVGEEVTGFVAINRDVTDLKAQERNLQRQNERLKQYGRTVAHDLRNPLTLVHAELERIRALVDGPDGEVDAADVRQRCGKLDDVVARMEALIDDLLEMAEQGQLVLDSEDVSLEAVATDAWTQIDAAGATLTVTDTVVDADSDRLRELLSNLFRNALEHAGEDVAVTAGPLDFAEGFFVEDDGPGIPEDEREQVLQRGFTTAEDGTGFGLAIVAEIARAHDWTVSVTEGDDGGARFEFREADR